jgi:serine/threonine protein kinase
MTEGALTEDPTPQEIGCYRIEGKLGQGGSSVVFRARDLWVDRPVALKLLGKLLDEEQRSRFMVEAQAAGRIVHPNVVQVYAVGEHEGRAYIVQELVEGLPLSDVLEARGRLSPEAVLEIGIQTARALECATLAGVLHRDVKPHNLLVDDEGLVKLADFGVAKLTQAPSYLTEAGTTIGTPHYMSPEQGRAEALDSRSDQYSLGATLYHLLTGQPPFDADHSLALLLKHLTEPIVPVREHAPDCPPGLARAVERMLAKRSEHRFESFAEVVEALEAVDEQESQLEESEPAREEMQESLLPVPEDTSDLPPTLGGPSEWQRRAPAVIAALSTTVVVGLLVISDHRAAETARGLPPIAPSIAKTSIIERVGDAAKPRVAPAPDSPAPDSLEALTAVLERGGSPAVRAARALGHQQDHQATPALIQALDSRDLETAVAAAEALGELGDLRALPALDRVEQSSAPGTLREAARRAHDRLWHVEPDQGPVRPDP